MFLFFAGSGSDFINGSHAGQLLFKYHILLKLNIGLLTYVLLSVTAGKWDAIGN